LESKKVATILSVLFCPYHFVRVIFSPTILSGHPSHYIIAVISFYSTLQSSLMQFSLNFELKNYCVEPWYRIMKSIIIAVKVGMETKRTCPAGYLFSPNTFITQISSPLMDFYLIQFALS